MLKKDEVLWGFLSGMIIMGVIYLGLCHLIKPEPELSPIDIWSEQRL